MLWYNIVYHIIFYYMFISIYSGFHSWDKFLIFHCVFIGHVIIIIKNSINKFHKDAWAVPKMWFLTILLATKAIFTGNTLNWNLNEMSLHGKRTSLILSSYKGCFYIPHSCWLYCFYTIILIKIDFLNNVKCWTQWTVL